MSRSILTDAFAHHAWANLQLIDICVGLTPEQLASSVPGTYGSILDTLRHTVGADSSYLNLLSGGSIDTLDEETLPIEELRPAAVRHGEAWTTVVNDEIDPDADVVRYRDDGSESHAPFGARLAQALHHGTDHRSQICTALTNLGIEPPEIDVWSFVAADGRAFITEPKP
jgi:uncharacterized damage-inducible protein DinB